MIYILIAVLLVAALMTGYLVKVNRMSREENVELEKESKSERASGREVGREPVVGCCGAHEVCEAETLLALSDKVIYYDDEELDEYRGIGADGYSDGQVDEFRDVLLTLKTHEVAGWLRSLSLRGVVPPTEIREEALMIVGEFREERAHGGRVEA